MPCQRSTRAVAVLGGLAVAGVLTACSSSPFGESGYTGQPPLPSKPSSTSKPAPVPSTPPPVTDPLNIRPFADRPCALLTKQQRTNLGFTDPEQEPQDRPIDDPTECYIRSNESSPSKQIFVRPFPKTDKLAQEYARGRSKSEVFEPSEIVGMPAIQRERYDDWGLCLITVGLAKNQGLEIESSQGSTPAPEACRLAIDAAEDVLSNLRPLNE